MTSWTKEIDSTSSYTKEDDQVTTYSGESDQLSPWSAYGGLIYLATEGLRERIMSEGNLDYLVYSKGVEGITWNGEADQSSVWTKVSDA